ncbi:MAG: putative MFS family arabinose efflux permease, partial [Rhodoferax sp.]
FAGGVIGGWLVKRVGASGLFATCAGLMLLWLVLAWPMHSQPTRASTLAPKAG